MSDKTILDNYTPTEWLVMEVLAARHRLGEACWTFPTSLRPALTSLQLRGAVGWKEGVAEGTCLAWLTDTGESGWHLDRPYEPILPSSQAGHWITPPATPHDCRMPGREGHASGAVWRCGCGRRWRLTEDERGFEQVVEPS